MDDNRFDSLTRALGSGRSRRSIVKGLGAAALGAVGLSRVGNAGAASGGNSACAKFCQTIFPPGAARGQCVSDAAHGTGTCVACGGNVANYCNGACTDVLTDVNNCGSCNNICGGDACNTATCSAGVCGTTPNPGAPCNGGAGLCDATGACVPVACTAGFSCENLTTCNGNNNCFCGPTTEGSACIVTNGGTCGDNCLSTAACVSAHGAGWACVTNTCCGSVCEQLCAPAGATTIRSAAIPRSGPQTP